MAYSTNKIEAPVSIYDIQKFFGRTSPDLGTLITEVNINKWAKYKPVILNVLDTVAQQTNGAWKDTATWWRGTNGNCGITYTSYTDFDSLIASIDSHAANWLYTPPSGGLTAPFRLIDFMQYNHSSPPPITSVVSSDAVMKSSNKMTIMAGKSIAAGDNLTLPDIGGLSSYFLTVAVYDESTFKFAFGDSLSFGNYADVSDITLEIPYSSAETGGYGGILSEGKTYKLYAFFSQYPYSTVQTSKPTGVFAPFPSGNNNWGLEPSEFRAKADSQWINIRAYTNLGKSIVNWTVAIYGAGSPTATIRLIDRQGNVVSGQSHEIDFSASSAIDVTADDGTPGRQLTNRLQTTLVIPSGESFENYMVEVVTLNMRARGIIGYDISETE